MFHALTLKVQTKADDKIHICKTVKKLKPNILNTNIREQIRQRQLMSGLVWIYGVRKFNYFLFFHFKCYISEVAKKVIELRRLVFRHLSRESLYQKAWLSTFIAFNEANKKKDRMFFFFISYMSYRGIS